MPLYVGLVTFTQKRIETIKDLPNGLAKAREMAKSFGVEFKSILYTLGQYDVVVTIEAPDDETIAKYLLAFSSLGLVRTQTLKAFTAEQFVKLISEI